MGIFSNEKVPIRCLYTFGFQPNIIPSIAYSTSCKPHEYAESGTYNPIKLLKVSLTRELPEITTEYYRVFLEV